jgi:aspartyl-tRNA(Asn)/glutamyl-tRNA(Gln) amidotransferase subunit B
VLAGEGEPEQVMTDRGLALVRDDSLTQTTVGEAVAGPDVTQQVSRQPGGGSRRAGA